MGDEQSVMNGMIEGGKIGEMGDEFACLISGPMMVANMAGLG
jgi:hypothetical protein